MATEFSCALRYIRSKWNQEVRLYAVMNAYNDLLDNFLAFTLLFKDCGLEKKSVPATPILLTLEECV